MLFQIYSCGWGCGVLLTLVILGSSGRAEGRGDWPGRVSVGVELVWPPSLIQWHLDSPQWFLHSPQSCVQARLFGDLWSRHRLPRAGLAAILTCWRNRALDCLDRIFLVTANSLQGLTSVSWLALQIQSPGQELSPVLFGNKAEVP